MLARERIHFLYLVVSISPTKIAKIGFVVDFVDIVDAQFQQVVTHFLQSYY